MTMNYQITYDPQSFRSFANESLLQRFLDEVMRTDLAQKWTTAFTRGNIYLVRHVDGELEYFTNVTETGRRLQLQRMVSEALRGISLERLRYDQVYISPNIENGEALDIFSELSVDTLPSLWKADCPVKGQEDMYLDNTFLMVLHTDQRRSDDDTLRYKVVRLYKI